MKFYCVYGHGKETEVSGLVGNTYEILKYDIPAVLLVCLTDHRTAACFLFICFHRRYARAPNTFDDNFGEAVDPLCVDSPTNDCKTPKVDIPLSRMSFIDSEYTDDSVNPKVSCLQSLLFL